MEGFFEEVSDADVSPKQLMSLLLSRKKHTEPDHVFGQ
jgi:catabolite regulation protein CreA